MMRSTNSPNITLVAKCIWWRKIGWVGAALLLGTCLGGHADAQPMPRPAGSQLGLDFDGLPRRFGPDDTEFARTRAHWLRAFYDVTIAVAQKGCDVAKDPDLNEIRMIHRIYGEKYKIAFSLKYDFTQGGVKQEPPLSGPSYDAVVQCTNKILDYVYPSINLLVSGNEPFITNSPSDVDVTTFYEQMTDNDIAYRARQAIHVPIYVGAFNNLQRPAVQTEAVKALLAYANNNPAVEGVDLHLHVASFNGDDGAEDDRFSNLDSGLVGAVEFARSQVPAKPFMSSEFSLVSYFLPFLKDPISAQFKSRNPTYEADAQASAVDDPHGNETVLGFYNYALVRGRSANPMPRREWVDFLATGDAVSPHWFTDRFVGPRNFLAQAQGFFDRNNFFVATYSLPYQRPQLVKSTNPETPYMTPVYWLASLFCNVTCPKLPDHGNDPGGNQFSLAVADDFIRLQPDGWEHW